MQKESENIFFINSIKSCGESIMGPEEHTQIESILEHKVIKKALKYIFLTRRWIKERIKSDSTWSHWLHLKYWVFLPKIGWVWRWSKGAVLAVFVSIVLPKRARWPPFFITVLSSPRLDTTVWKFPSEIYVRFFYQGITLMELRQSYWIPKGRQLVKTEIRKCVTCRVEGPPFRSVHSPALPDIRVTGSQPFQVTGIDYAGPL